MTVSPAGTKAGFDRGGVVVRRSLVYDGNALLKATFRTKSHRENR